MKNKKQILFIHGGYTFGNRKDYLRFLKNYPLDPYKKKKYWINWLAGKLKNQYEVLIPQMPCGNNAHYEEWKIWFEKYIPFIKDKNPILIGHSLGAIFLIKYFSENKFPKRVYQLHLIGPAIFDDNLGPEKLSTFKVELNKIKKLQKHCREIHLWHSIDDPICPFKNSEEISRIIPSIHFHKFKTKGHFKQSSFPEILKTINS